MKTKPKPYNPNPYRKFLQMLMRKMTPRHYLAPCKPTMMSMQAQAERERQARVILSESEMQIATRFEEAAKSYAKNPVALHLRAMNILLEGMRNNSTIMVVPSSAVETLGIGVVGGLASLGREVGGPHPVQVKPVTGAAT